MTIRGIGTNSTVVGADPSATVHLDGVYLGRPVMVLADFLNVERVEVLRGPQGTLYGRNSVGGTINIVTRQPTNALETSLRLTAGNYDTLRAEGVVSGPLLKDKVMGTVAFLRSGRDGFVKDLDHPDHRLGSEDTWAGRGQLRLVLGNKGELLLSGDYGRFDGVPLNYAKPIVAKPGFSYDSPSSLWAVRTSHVTSGKNTQQGVVGTADCPFEPDDDADQSHGVSNVRLPFLHRRRRDGTDDCRPPTFLTSSASSRRSSRSCSAGRS